MKKSGVQFKLKLHSVFRFFWICRSDKGDPATRSILIWKNRVNSIKIPHNAADIILCPFQNIAGLPGIIGVCKADTGAFICLTAEEIRNFSGFLFLRFSIQKDAHFVFGLILFCQKIVDNGMLFGLNAWTHGGMVKKRPYLLICELPDARIFAALEYAGFQVISQCAGGKPCHQGKLFKSIHVDSSG